MKALKTRRRRVAPAPVAPSLQIDLDGDWRRYTRLLPKDCEVIVELVFDQTKEARGLRRFFLCGLEKVNAEWALLCKGHNLRKLFRATTVVA